MDPFVLKASLCKLYFFWSFGIMYCMLLFLFENYSSANALGGPLQWCGIFHHHWWTAATKPRLLFSPCMLHVCSLNNRDFPFSHIKSTSAHEYLISTSKDMFFWSLHHNSTWKVCTNIVRSTSGVVFTTLDTLSESLTENG